MKYMLTITAALVTLFAAMRVSGQGRIVEMGITSSEMASYFQAHAGAQDIARVDHPNDHLQDGKPDSTVSSQQRR